jgi:cardiolipin synthase
MSTWVFIAVEWLIALAMVPVVLARRRPSTALAWLLVIFMFPIVGLCIYLLVGETRLGRRRARRYAEARRVIETIPHREMHRPHVVEPRIRAEQRDLVRLTERLSHMPVLGGNSVDMFGEGGEMIDALVRDIEAARSHVHLLYYIFASDETGLRVAEAVARASGRGVTCRVLVDDAGSKFAFSRAESILRRAHVRTRRMLPVSLPRMLLARLDVRNHRKLAVIDGAIAFVGSQNIVNAGVGPRRRGEWRDLTVRLTGPAVIALQTVFTEDWYAETDELLEGDEIYPRPRVFSGTAVQIAPSGPDSTQEAFGHLIVSAVHEARERVTITTPYFVPDEPTLQALRIAALRGVEVEIVVPRRSDAPLVDAACRSHLDPLMEAGVRVYLHGPAVLHSKTLAVDDSFVLIGSGNLDIRSFALNYELNVILYGPRVTDELRRHQVGYLSEARVVDPDEWRRRSLIGRMLDRIANLLSPLL